MARHFITDMSKGAARKMLSTFIHVQRGISARPCAMNPFRTCIHVVGTAGGQGSATKLTPGSYLDPRRKSS
jgi:hypothetical protein